MDFTISFEDIISAIEKAIEEHPVATVATIASIVVGGYLVHRSLRSEPIHTIGSLPRGFVSSMGDKEMDILVHSYRSPEHLRGLEKACDYKGCDSEDECREFVTTKKESLPGTDDEMITGFNCWSWAINPINGKITDSDPIPNLKQPFTIKKMTSAVTKYLNAMINKKLVLAYKITEDADKVVRFIGDSYAGKLIIALRVYKNPPNVDYHFLRWYNGQWSTKYGVHGRIVKSTSDVNTSEPETMWATIYARSTDPNSIHMRPGSDKEIEKEPIYKGPTVYFFITLPPSNER